MVSSESTALDALPAGPIRHGFASQLIAVYLTPVSAFQGICRKPRIIAPLLALLAVSAAVMFLTINRVGLIRYSGQDFEAAVATGQMSPEEVEEKVRRLTDQLGPTVIIATVSLAKWGKLVLLTLIVAAWFRLIGAWRTSAGPFRQLFSAALYSVLAPTLISSALLVGLLYLTDPSETNTNRILVADLGSLLTGVLKMNLPAFFRSAAAWVDVFNLWMIALLAVGCSVAVPRLKIWRALLLVAMPYAGAMLFSAGIAAIVG